MPKKEAAGWADQATCETKTKRVKRDKTDVGKTNDKTINGTRQHNQKDEGNQGNNDMKRKETKRNETRRTKNMVKEGKREKGKNKTVLPRVEINTMIGITLMFGSMGNKARSERRYFHQL